MRTEGWRGNGKKAVPRWRLEARKANTIASKKSFSMGGLPRSKRVAAVSLPKFSCQEGETS